MYKVKAYGVTSPTSAIEALTIPRRDLLKNDIKISILYCGICHSDLHYARNEWSEFLPTIYPAVPGHEIIGRVSEVGIGVKEFRVGDTVGVGCLVDSDRSCANCREGLEQYCPAFTLTYGTGDPHGTSPGTLGGYSQEIVVDENYVLRIPKNLNLAAAAPLLCAGITTYSPMKHWNAGPGKKVGVVGIGGLGHMGIKFAHALGAQTVVFTTSPSKKADAVKLGADEVVISTDPRQMEKHVNTFDFILDCVAVKHDVNAYINLLKRDGNLTVVGAPPEPMQVAGFGLIFGRRSLSGSAIGSLKETQEMLDFCGEHNITADVEVIGVDQINKAYERILKSDIKYRFTIDMSTL